MDFILRASSCRRKRGTNEPTESASACDQVYDNGSGQLHFLFPHAIPQRKSFAHPSVIPGLVKLRLQKGCFTAFCPAVPRPPCPRTERSENWTAMKLLLHSRCAREVLGRAAGNWSHRGMIRGLCRTTRIGLRGLG
jgi:hypothetical protein